MKHATKHFLNQMRQYKVGGDNGFEFGVIELKNILQIDADLKKEISVNSGMPEIGFIAPLSLTTYDVEFYRGGQLIDVCGHGFLSIAKYISNDTRFENIFFLSKGCDAKIIFDESENYSLLMPNESETRLVGFDKMRNIYFDENQQKYIIVYNNLYDMMNFDPTESKNKGVVTACHIADGLCHASFYRNEVQDSLHISGLVPLGYILNIESKIDFLFPSGNKATLEKIEEGFLITSPVIELERDLGIMR